ncbi:helix-turn-helix domain-containing protein [Nocardia nova]|uniref:helix-turn-helix domain-containing protein n=1 Tax=Nocardia nova TaxID=37330 RepID=UPI0033CDA034
MTERDSSITRRQLGRYLREAREAVGMRLEDAAALMEWGKSSLQRLEKGQNQKVRIGDLDGLIEIYGIEDELADALRRLAQQTAGKSWWDEIGGFVPANFSVYLGLEAGASTLRSYQSCIVPGLLQTADYARVLVRACCPNENDDQIGGRIAIRMRRQTLVSRKRKPVRLEVVLSESALYRTVGSHRIMAHQLRHIADMSTRPNISVQVLPFDAGMPTGYQVGPFVILDFDTGPRGRTAPPTTVYSEGFTSDMYSEKVGVIKEYSRAFDTFRKAALSEVDTRGLLRAAARNHASAPRRSGPQGLCATTEEGASIASLL